METIFRSFLNLGCLQTLNASSSLFISSISNPNHYSTSTKLASFSFPFPATMHRLSRRSSGLSSAILARSCHHRSAAVATASRVSPDSGSENETGKRWYSMLGNGVVRPSMSRYPSRNGWFIGVRSESTATESDASSPPPVSGEKHEYQAEVSGLMDLIVNSFYSNKDVFLRELISNASDALDKLRFLSVTDNAILGGGGDLDIHIQGDKENGVITITDSGIGMTRQELIDCLGTIAQSGIAKFLQTLKDTTDGRETAI